MSEWQPIETAPKDGTQVLVADAGVWMACARHWPCNSYWTEDVASALRLNEPTHWMPLPDHPVGPSGRSGDSPQEKTQHPGASSQPAESAGNRTGGGE